MYFKKLQISGFKSFAGKTVLHFEPGITAVVGPNGCGKSNVFDSIRWCLGEQSIKSLRGSKMEDVIFNGTETAPPQNVAEVSLTISNEANILPIDYDEVTIARRLYRSGESEYLINNNSVRLKDINEMLMGTGIGAESYSLVEQGKIDLVISSRPEDRRLVFDEATGVSRYKAKKKEAMKKLEETDNNLLRVNDILTEVKRQIGSIERQANKARKYKEIFDKLKDLEIKYSSYELKTLSEELSLTSEMLKNAQAEELKISQELQAFDSKLINQQRELQELDAKHSELKNEITWLENNNERNRQHINLNQDRIVDLENHTRILGSQKEQLKEKIENHEKSVKDLSDQLVNLAETNLRKENDLREKEDKFNALIQEIENLTNECKSLKQRVFDISMTETQANNELNEINSSLHTDLSRLRRLETEKIKTEEENHELLKNIEEVIGTISAQKDIIKSLTEKINALKNELSESRNALKETEETLRKLDNEKVSLHSQIEFLKTLKSRYDSIPDAEDGILEISKLPQENISGIIAHAKETHFNEESQKFRITCELKFISFDLEKLSERIEEIERETEGLAAKKSEKEILIAQISENLQIQENQAQEERIALSNKEAIRLNLDENAKRISDELSVIGIEISEINENIANERQKEERLKNELTNIKQENAQIDTKIHENNNKINEDIPQKENLLVEITQLKTELNNQKSKEDSLQNSLNFFRETLTQDHASLGLNEKEISESLKKIDELSDEIQGLETKIEDNESAVAEKTNEFNKLSSIRIEEINSIDFTRKQIIDLEEKADKIKEDHHHYQMQEQELNFKFSGIKNRILQTYGIDIEKTPTTEEELTGINIQLINDDISALKEKVSSFGTVNLVAIEELEELKNRYDFLNQQQNDLNTAKDSLQKAIIKINRTTRKMFLETFQMVAEEFKNYYKLLFGGGEAKLYLLDEEDVLESGIEIICRPPGKKLQNISLLSGGEKALSAIALIFAIFKTKPSPFCVLDEIDAALDESNIDRFSRMLSDFSKTSQFIVITHNKKTISRSNVIYGITMEQSGMSKIVSVKLHETPSANALPLSHHQRINDSAAQEQESDPVH
ncbi:MAG: AAA family ATPase [Candidatus Omnitrophota bacterium]